jgi:hypothetical protein
MEGSLNTKDHHTLDQWIDSARSGHPVQRLIFVGDRAITRLTGDWIDGQNLKSDYLIWYADTWDDIPMYAIDSSCVITFRKVDLW